MHLMTHIVMLFVVIGLIRWVRASRGAREFAYAAPALSGGRAGVLQDEVVQLRQRIATLERIAVDGRSSAALSAEIDALRD